MADPLSREEARRQFQAVTHGRAPRRADLSLAEAKARLRDVDAGLDIGPALRFATRGEWKPALLSLAGWSATAEGRAWLAPLLLRGLEAFYLVLGLVQKPRPATTEPEKPDDTAAAKPEAD